MRALAVVCVVCSSACGTASREPASSVPSSPTSTPTVEPVCDLGPLPEPLEAYDDITEGRRFWLDLEEDGRGVWLPVSQLRMPLHHASTIVWEDRETLDREHGHPVRAIAIGLGRISLDHDPERGAWFATYGARIELACPIDEPSPSP